VFRNENQVFGSIFVFGEKKPQTKEKVITFTFTIFTVSEATSFTLTLIV
jgi:hypothetical protein